MTQGVKAAEAARVHLEQAREIATGRLAEVGANGFAAFLEEYYRNALPDDVLARTPEALVAAALGHWRFIQVREAGHPRIRVFNPRLETDGWHSSHTVIETVCDDMPFLLDSILAEMSRAGRAVHLVLHPIIAIRRDGAGACTGLGGEGARPESLVHVEVDEESSAEGRAALETALRRILADVQVAVADWRAMLDKVHAICGELDATTAGDPAERAEARAFLEWLADDHFTLLGYRYYARRADGTMGAVEGLGLMRDPDRHVLALGLAGEGAQSGDAVHHFHNLPGLVLATKGNVRSTVHRRVHLDFIGIKQLDAGGAVVGEHRLVGLFTSTAYATPVRKVPLLRAKANAVLARAGFRPQSHDGKALAAALEAYPRDELFQIEEEQLFAFATEMVRLGERPRTRLLLRRDPFGRFVSALVFVPRDRFDTSLRIRIEAILVRAYGVHVSARTTEIGAGDLARLHLIIKATPGEKTDVDDDAVEAEIKAATRNWSDELAQLLVDRFGEDEGIARHRRWGAGFAQAYRDAFVPALAVGDVDRLENVGRGLSPHVVRRLEDPDQVIRIKLYTQGQPIVLSDILPLLEHLGLKVLEETSYEVVPHNPDGRTGPPVHIHEFRVADSGRQAINLGEAGGRIAESLEYLWAGALEDDSLNRLVLHAGLDWRALTLLRALARYLRQVGIPYSQDYMATTLGNHPGIVRDLVALFAARLDPAFPGDRGPAEEALLLVINAALDKVASLDEDRILRRFLNLIQATLRTNFYQRDEAGSARPALSLKLDSRAVTDLPAPRPAVEVFVYSPRVEAIHLRGGKVARGGIRWSDRREDFRTEILGLLKAQMVKNAVIVPTGAKGGFFPKNLPAEGGREAIQAEAIACYQTFIRALLDITDNLGPDGAVIPPRQVTRRDGDDPYLVVAADKGTATFSDIANAISIDYGFWLGDAFASGGSAGYDHKAMGITARGAWIAVERHFLELGKVIARDSFTCVGVGDMSGDVFGNGMLLSRTVKLVAAFNHMHIFLDPDPDPERSFAERQRLFNLPRSTWADYDATLISAGGGIYPRSLKAIPLTPEVRALTGLQDDKVSPSDLIRALLQAPVDLLWLGGIGTYVKGAAESNAEVGDRANDVLRINGSEVRARIVGEGANLGFTQRARIDYARAGGRINTDAIDNSAGVDCSDHEVNIKILLNAICAEGDLTTKQRDVLLAEMTEEVADLVLRDNYMQTQAISVIQARGSAALDAEGRLMRLLEREGRLDRAVEVLPDQAGMDALAQAKQGLTRPELAVLLAYGKTSLNEALLEGDAPDDAFFESDLARYFPKPLRKRFPQAIARHRLRREIISTQIANSIVNWVGPTFVSRIQEATGFDASTIARAYVTTRGVFDLRPFWTAVGDLDGKVPAALQYRLLLDSVELVRRATMWFLHNVAQPMDVAQTLALYAPAVQELRDGLPNLLPEPAAEALEARAYALTKEGVTARTARMAASFGPLQAAADVVLAAQQAQRPLADVAHVFYGLGGALRLNTLREAALAMQPADHWERLALTAVVDDLFAQQRALTVSALQRNGGLDGWLDANAAAIARAVQIVDEIQGSGGLSLAKLGFASRHIRGQLGP
ncbi:NAD-glutamate dehydrogenase [Zavarzinia sp. CC-PAN008]|uniref:NAD-glutamate dehydrogenase n=1 Tax=Zavarzinia sp. CC-PAN008 TaxID=3243332 RepID=UPI003F746431